MKGASIRKLTLSAVLIAMQIVLARFFGFQINEGLRVSLEGIPIILAGLWLGPVYGMIVGGMADVLGTILSGYGTYFPLLTIGPMLLGGLCGLGARWLPGDAPDGWRFAWRFFAVVVVAESINSLLYGTWALTLYYSIIMGKDMPFSVLFLARLATKPVTIAVDAVLTYSIYRLLYRRMSAMASGGGAAPAKGLQEGNDRDHEL